MKRIFVLFLLIFSTTSNAANLWDSRQLLLDKQFDILESQFTDADQALLSKHPKAAHVQFFTYDSLWKSRDFFKSDILDSLNEWHLARPNSYAPLVALGKYYLNYGYFLRGSKFAKFTSNISVRNMESEHRKAKLFFLEAIEKNPSALFAYIGLIHLDRTIPILKQVKSFDIAKKIKNIICSSKARIIYDYAMSCEPDPIQLSKTNVFLNAPKQILKIPQIWKRFIQNYPPRWGGGYDTMESVKDQASDYLSEGQLFQLTEVIVTDKMDLLIRDKNFDDAEKLGLEFLANVKKTYSYKHEEFSGYIHGVLARTYMKSKKYEKCIEHSDIASRLYFWDHHTWSNYGFCAIHLKSYELANFAFRYSVDIEAELDEWSAFYLGMSYLRVGNYKLAFILLTKSVELDPAYSNYADLHLKWIKENEPESVVPVKIIYSEIVGELGYDGILLN